MNTAVEQQINLKSIAPYGLSQKVLRSMFIVCVLTSLSYEISADPVLCRAFTEHFNPQLPMQVDSMTTLRNVSCPVYGNSTVLTYNYVVSSTTLTQDDINRQRPSMVNSWCTTPEMRTSLEIMGVQYLYYRANGEMFARLNITLNACQ